MHSRWEKFLIQPRPCEHVVQLCPGNDQALVDGVSTYFRNGVERGDGVLAVTTPQRWASISGRLRSAGLEVESLMKSRQIVVRDAQQTLAELMTDGELDWTRFEKAACAIVTIVQPAKPGAGLRAFGEMVGLLWKSRQYAAAIQLEHFWNRLQTKHCLSIYCAYPIDIFTNECPTGSLDEMVHAHSHVAPADADGGLEMAVNRAMDEILGPHAYGLRALIRADHEIVRHVPSAESIVLWLRKNHPGQADGIIARARHHYQLMLSSAPA